MAQNPPPVQIVIAAVDKTKEAATSAVAGIEQIKASAAGLQGVLAGATAALAGLTAVVQFQKFVEAAAAFDDMAERTGATVEKLSALAGVAKISGISLDIVENSLIRLAKGLAGADEESKGAGNALAALGLKAEELKKLDTADALKIVADRLNEYKDGVDKTALAIDLLGKSGAQALPYLKDLAETQELQARLTAEQAAQAENLQKNLNRLAASTSGAWKEFSAAVLPTVDAFIESLLKAVNSSGGLRDEIKKLAADGSIRDWAETGAIGVAYLVDAFKNVINIANVAGNVVAKAAVDFQIIAKSAQSFAEGPGRNRGTEQQIASLRRIQTEALAGLGESFDKLLNAPQFSQAVRERFEKMRNEAAQVGAAKPPLPYSSRIDKDAAAAQDQLKAIESYAQQINEQVVGVTDGEFEKMRQKMVDVFSGVDLSQLAPKDADRFIGFLAKVGEQIEQLEQRARTAQGLQQYAEQANALAAAAKASDEALGDFRRNQFEQVDALKFELETVGKLTTERQKLAAVRRIDAEYRAAARRISDDDPQQGEKLRTLTQDAEKAKAAVIDMSDAINAKTRDFNVGLQSSISQYLNRIADGAANIQQLFNTTFRSMEDALVGFVTKGKLDFKSFADAVIADIARIVIRQQITGPIAQAIGGGSGGGLLGNLFGGLFGNRSATAGNPEAFGGYDLPSFAVGTDYVPRDMIAQIHRGERIVPAAQNVPGGGAPVINVINQAAGVEAVPQVRIDGDRYITDVFVRRLRTDANLRGAVAGALRAPA